VFVSSRRDAHGNQMLMADYSIAYSFVHIIDSSDRDEEGLRYLRFCACYQKTIVSAVLWVTGRRNDGQCTTNKFITSFQAVKLSNIVGLAKEASVDVKFELPIWRSVWRSNVSNCFFIYFFDLYF